MEQEMKTREVAEHLEGCLESRSRVNGQILRDFVLGISGGGNPVSELLEERKVTGEQLGKVVLAVNRVLNDSEYAELDPEGEVVSMLRKVLMGMHMADILQLYSPEFVINGLQGGLGVSCMVVDVLAAKADEDATVELMRGTLVMTVLLKRLFCSDCGVEFESRCENLIKVLAASRSPVASGMLLGREFCEFYKSVKMQRGSKVFTLMDYILLLLPAGIRSRTSIPKDIYVFSKSECGLTDTLDEYLYVQYYVKLVALLANTFDENIFVNSKPVLRELVSQYHISKQDEDRSLYSYAIVELVLTLSTADVLPIQTFTRDLIDDYELFKPDNFDLELQADFRLLRDINPNILPSEFYVNTLQDVSLLSKKYFDITINLIASEEMFGKMAPVLTSKAITGLPFDFLHTLIFRLTCFPYGIHHLIHQLPTIVSNHLVSSTNVTETNILKLKTDSLYNLLNSDEDLEMFHDGLSTAYAEITGKIPRRNNNAQILNEST